MCRFRVSESGLIIIVAFLLLKSRSHGHAGSTDNKRSTHSKEFYYEDYDYDARSKASVHQRQVRARDLNNPPPPVSVHSYEKGSHQSSADADPSTNGYVHKKVRRQYTRSIDSGFQVKNEEMKLEQNDKTTLSIINSFKRNFREVAEGSNVEVEGKTLEEFGNMRDSAVTVSANAELEDHKGFNTHGHDDNNSFLAHENHHFPSREGEPNFEFVASASAFHEVVQVSPSDIRDRDSLSTDAEHFGHDQTPVLSHTISKREALAGRVEGRQKQEKALIYYRKIPVDNDGNLRDPISVCELGKDNGYKCPNLLYGKFQREYYYNPANNRCSHFMFKGCGGNPNRFPSMKACAEFCEHPKLNIEAISHGTATI